jgi:uncharacterized membrane protein YphA (DoxX/SURF4 family)
MRLHPPVRNDARTSSKYWSAVFLRLALASGFLSSVADRFGLWGSKGQRGVDWGDFGHFVANTGRMLWYLPARPVFYAAVAATVAEIVLGTALLFGVCIRASAFASGVLLLVFAFAMVLSTGIKSVLSYSVFSAAAAAFMLAASYSQHAHVVCDHASDRKPPPMAANSPRL